MFFHKVLSFSEVKKEPFIINNIRWDLEPKDMMEPRCIITEEGIKKREPIKGYIFYIDAMEDKPRLFLMRHTAAEYAETLAEVEEIPEQLLFRAIEENKDKEYFKMYPINKEIEKWLKKELGIE